MKTTPMAEAIKPAANSRHRGLGGSSHLSIQCEADQGDETVDLARPVESALTMGRRWSAEASRSSAQAR